MNIGKWTQDKHKVFMKEWEKYANNWMGIAKVLSTQTPIQIKKCAECHFKQNWKTNAPAVYQYQESISPDDKAQILVDDAAAHQNIDNLSHPRTTLKCY
jgi:hypothetical protein